MKIDQLAGFTTFFTVARRLSFVAAAREMRVTAPAVSQQISALETRLGVRLFNRTTRSVSLTEAGANLLQRIEPSMQELMNAGSELTASGDEPAGRLRVNLPMIALDLFVTKRLPEFAAAYPRIELELYVEDTVIDIVKDRFDVGIRLGELLQKDVVARSLSKREETAVVASPKYLKQHGTPKHPKELVAHACICYRLRTSGSLYRWEFEEKGREILIDPSGPLVVNEPRLALEAASLGLGITYTIASYAKALEERGKVTRILQSFCPRFPGFYLYYPSRRLQPAKVKAFVDFFCA